MLNFTKPKTMVLGSLLSIVLVVLALFFNREKIDTYGTNKTISWAFDYEGFSPLFVFAALFIFVSGYLILWIAKKATHKILSILNFVLLFGSIVFFMVNLHTMAMIIAFFSIQLNIANMFFGLVAKTNTKKKN